MSGQESRQRPSVSLQESPQRYPSTQEPRNRRTSTQEPRRPSLAGPSSRNMQPSVTEESEAQLLFRNHRLSKSIVRRERLGSAGKAYGISGVRSYFNEYASITVIHGVRMLADDRHWCEKVVWSVASLSCFCVGIFLIAQLYLLYEASAIIVSFHPKPYPITEIPFPAVCICPEVKSDPRLFSYSEARRKLYAFNATEQERLHYEYFYLMCDNRDDAGVNWSSTIKNESDLFRVYRDFQTPLNEWMLHCYTMDAEVDCSTLFTPIVTDEGICWASNMADRQSLFTNDVVWHMDLYRAVTQTNSWSNYDGYRTSHIMTYPRRAAFLGVEHGVQVVLQQRRAHVDYMCKSGMRGFRAALYLPTELPRLRHRHFRVAVNRQTVISVEPHRMTNSEQVLAYPLKYRQCYTPLERPLKYFKIYSQNNCLMECEANYTLAHCGCVPFFMPRVKDTKICAAGNWACYLQKSNEWERKIIRDSLKQDVLLNIGGSCKCLPLCNHLEYKTVISLNRWRWRNLRSAGFGFRNACHSANTVCGHIDNNVAKCKRNGECDFALISIYFIQDTFLRIDRHEHLGMAEMFSRLGGLLNFFLGMSLLTLVEIAYFLTLRIGCNKRISGHWWKTT